MGDYRKIFLIVDPSRQPTPAFRRAIRLAHASGARLHLGLYEHSAAISALGVVNPDAMQQARRDHLHELERWLDGVARKLTDEGVLTNTEVDLHTPAHDAIALRVADLAPDLVLKDVHHEPLLSRVLYTPLDWQLLRLCPAPLLLVAGRKDHWPRRVIAAVDPLDPADSAGALNDRIVQEALRLAIQFNAEVHLIHAFEGVPAMMIGEVESAQGIALAYQERSDLDRTRFEEFARRHSVPSDRMHLLKGIPSELIPEFARDATADLVVLGTVYRTGLSRLLIGSTAERLLAHIRCDVLAVKPDGFAADLARHLGMPLVDASPRQQAAA